MDSQIHVKMNLTKRIIEGKIPSCNQTVYCSAGEVPDDKNSVLLGYHDCLPVVSNKSLDTTASPKKTTLKVEVDPNTGNRFIRLNGQRLRMLYDSEIPLHIKQKTQKVKLNAVSPVIIKHESKSPIQNTVKTLCIPREAALNAVKESRVYITNKNVTNNLSLNSINKTFIKVEPSTPSDVIPLTDNIQLKQINSDKHACTSSTFSAVPKTFTQLVIKPINKTNISETLKMQPIDLTKQDKGVVTDNKKGVDMGVQVNLEINRRPLLLEEFDNLDPLLDLNDIFNIDPRPPTPMRVLNSPFPNVPTKQLTNLNILSEHGTEKQKLAARFFTDLRTALRRDDKGNM